MKSIFNPFYKGGYKGGFRGLSTTPPPRILGLDTLPPRILEVINLLPQTEKKNVGCRPKNKNVDCRSKKNVVNVDLMTIIKDVKQGES